MFSPIDGTPLIPLIELEVRESDTYLPISHEDELDQRHYGADSFPRWKLNAYFKGSSRLMYQIPLDIFRRHPDLSGALWAFSSKPLACFGGFPRRMRRLTEKLILFVITTLSSYIDLKNIGRKEEARTFSSALEATTPRCTIGRLLSDVLYTLGTGFLERDMKGLLRNKQIRLVNEYIDAWICDVRCLITDGCLDYRTFRLRFVRLEHGLFRFFSKIRSERIEDRILRFLYEEGCNLDVARGVEAATCAWESQERYYGSDSENFNINIRRREY